MLKGKADFTRFTAMINAPVIGVDRHMRIELWNPYLEKMSGFSASDAMRENLVEKFIDPANRAKVK